MKSLALVAMMLFAQIMNTGPYRHKVGGLNSCAVSAWPMNEGSGTTLFDHGPAANNMTMTTNPGWTTATGFPGFVPLTGMTATAASSTSLFTGNSPFTVVMWNNDTTGSNPDPFFDTSLNLTTPGIYIRRGGSGDNKFEVVLESGAYPTGAAFLQSSYTPNGTVQYFAVVYNGTSPAASNFTLYVNGSPVSYSILTNNLSSTVTSTNPIKTLPAANQAYVETYNCALTATQLAAFYARGPAIN